MENKIFLQPGDVVQVKQDIPNKPIMMVYKIERNLIRNKENSEILRGIKCRWFTDNGFIQEAIFSTKDLLKL